jgi:hypothetical protein
LGLAKQSISPSNHGERRSALDFVVESAMKKLQIISEDVQGLVKADKFTGHSKKGSACTVADKDILRVGYGWALT